MRLLLSQKNTVFQIIENNDYFSPQNFEIIEKNSPRVETCVQFKKSDFKFSLVRNLEYTNAINVHHWPGENQIMECFHAISWDNCLNRMMEWLYYLEREVTAPNLWERFQSSISGLELSNEFNNTKFTHQEYIELSAKMNQLIDKIPDVDFLKNDALLIKNQLNSILEKTNDLGEYDWKNLFVGTIISIIIQLNVTPDNAAIFWQLIKDIFSNYFLE